ncbi:MAG: hypothetical protein RL398_3307 [Planctomycetota bacterium]|jgi:type II secretory pathway pseudopilin PulG
MSTTRTARARRFEAGFSMIEMIVAALLLSLMILAVTTLAINGGDAQEYARRLNRSTEITQDLIDQLRMELLTSIRVFGNDQDGADHLDRLDLAGAPPLLAGSVLPTVSAVASIDADTVERALTGNSLFFARLGWTDRYRCTSGEEYLVDVYRWVYYYLTPEDGGPMAGRAIGLNLVRVESEPLVDGIGIDRISSSTDRAQVLRHLAQGTADVTGQARPKAAVVWLRDGDPATSGTFRQINESTGALSNSPSGRPSPWTILRSESRVQGLLSYRHHSIATEFGTTTPASRFGVRSTTGVGFPHGFEVQVVGPSSARQILIHFAVASTNQRGLTAYADQQVVLDVRDL